MNPGRSLCLALCLLASQVLAQAPAADCPPPLQAPTQEQVQAAASAARDRGALWRVSRGGHSSYLFGTIHVGKLDWAAPGPQMRAALNATDTIALEIDPTDPQMAAGLATMGSASGGAPPSLPSPLAARLAGRLASACVPAAARPVIGAMHPVMQVLTLSVLEARREGLEAGYAQEFVLAGFGRAAKRPIVSLETPESQLAALMPRGTDELNQAVAGALDQLDQGQSRQTITRLAQAWARGDLEDLAQYEQWCDCIKSEADRKMMKRLLDDRNPPLAERIEALHREGRKVFAGVGALHMVGATGLPTLLRARGFTVERVAFQ